MRDPMPTIESEWGEYVAELLPGLSPAQLEPYRAVFLSGFLSMLTLALELNNPKVDARTRTQGLVDLFLEHRELTAEVASDA